MRYKTVLLFGAPGSGKGTQGKLFGALPGYFHCACGDVFRSLDPQSPLGKTFGEFSRTGSLVPDELTIELWRHSIQTIIEAGKVNPQTDTLLLDGIPRTVDQAKLLDDKIEVNSIVYLVCNNISEIIARLQNRAIKGNRADDANEEIIRHRLDVYEEQTRPVLEHYPRAKIFRINATQPLENVTAQIMQSLELQKK